MKENRLIRITGDDYYYFFREYEAPEFDKEIKIENPAMLEILDNHILDPNEMEELFDKGLLTRDLVGTIERNDLKNIDIYTYSYYNEKNNKYIPTMLKKRNGILIGKKHSKHYHLNRHIGIILYYIIYFAIAIKLVMLFIKK